MIRDWFIIAASAAILITTMVLGYMMFLDGTWPVNAVKWETVIMETDKKQYHPGDLVMMHKRQYKTRDVQGTIRWSLINHRSYEFAERSVGTDVGVVNQWVPIETIPNPWPHGYGEHKFIGLGTYRINPFRIITYRIETEPFDIIPMETQ